MESGGGGGGGEKGQSAPPAQEDNQPDAGHDSQPKFRALFAYSGQHEDELSFQVDISNFRDDHLKFDGTH